jgi:hypothetical protein
VHAFDEIPPQLYIGDTSLVIYKSSVDFGKIKDGLYNLDNVRQTWQRVNAHPNEYYFEVVNF